MEFQELIRNFAAVTGGVAVYFITKMAAGLANINIRKDKLTPETIGLMRPLFPGLDVEHVRIKEGSTIPPNWFRKRKKYSAITFGYTIYFTGRGMQDTNENLNILMHELVHTDQVRLRKNSEARFAADYGIGFLLAGNYRCNPLEQEAFDFVSAHQLPVV